LLLSEGSAQYLRAANIAFVIHRNTSKNEPPKLVHWYDFVILPPLKEYLGVQGQYNTFEPQLGPSCVKQNVVKGPN